MQGDTGPVNFMFDGDEVSAIIDLEWAHLGDPLEDIGNICVREFWNPSGGLDGLFHLYEAESGIPYERFAAQYYRVQQNVRGMIPIHFITENAHPRESLAWYLCYRYVGDRSTCESIAEAAGHHRRAARSCPPTTTASATSWPPRPSGRSSATCAPSSPTPSPPHGRRTPRRSSGSWTAAAASAPPSTPSSATSWPTVLGARPATRAEGMRLLDEAITAGSVDDAAVITYLTRRAYRDEWLYEPAVSLYPERTWSALDD